MKTAKHLISEQLKRFYKEVLHRNNFHPDYPKDGIIDSLSVTFDNGYQADIKLCNSDEESSPWVDAVLFDENGCELAVIEPQDSMTGEFVFEYEDEFYRVIVDSI